MPDKRHPNNKSGITYADLVKHLQKPRDVAKKILLCIIKENGINIKIEGLNNRSIIDTIAEEWGLRKVDVDGKEITDAKFEDIEEAESAPAEDTGNDDIPVEEVDTGEGEPVSTVLTPAAIRRMNKSNLIQLAMDNKIPYTKPDTTETLSNKELAKAIIKAEPWEDK